MSTQTSQIFLCIGTVLQTLICQSEYPLGGIQKMLSKYIKRAEIGRANIHTLRHTCGAQHLAKGAELKTIQDVMG